MFVSFKDAFFRLVLYACLLTSILLTACNDDAREAVPPARDSKWVSYVEDAIDLIQERSIKRDSVAWGEVRREALERINKNPSRAKAYVVIEFVLGRLGDNHSVFLTPEEVKAQSSGKASVGTPPSAAHIEPGMGYISVTGVLLGQSGIGSYADALQGHIRSLDEKSVCGWIVDLRDNTGGNVSPMLIGLGALLGEGDLVASVDVRSDVVWTSYRDGQLFRGGHVVEASDELEKSYPGAKEAYRLHQEPYRLRAPGQPVAVLIGGQTASSGEVVLVAFLGREATRTFGTKTRGIPTGNGTFFLSDGAVLYLTTTLSQDRHGRRYAESIAPDESVGADPRAPANPDDEVVERAKSWLLTQEPCKSQ